MSSVTNRTYFASPAERDEEWFLVDARNETLGRLATNIVRILRGKHRPQYTPHINSGAHVIVINTSAMRVTGSKQEKKQYHRYTGYPGGLRTRSYEEAVEHDPTFPLRSAIRGMLQHNTLGRDMLTCVRIYADDHHEHHAQKPVRITFGRLGEIVRDSND
ncbi:MAG: 50S ribosomal protein L13 [Candidatus Dormibacteria bacterium]